LRILCIFLSSWFGLSDLPAQTRYDLGLSTIVELSQAQLTKTNADIQNAAVLDLDHPIAEHLRGPAIEEPMSPEQAPPHGL
jgi:hypothetical protein